MLWKSVQFIRHYVSSKSRHGTHSPFVYQLIESCFYSKQPKLPKAYHEAFRELMKDQRVVEGMDYGQGRKRSFSIARRVKSAAIPTFQAELLFRVVNFFDPKLVVELGSNVGKSLCAMALASDSTACIGVEGNKALVEVCKRQLKALEIQNATLNCDKFSLWLEYAPQNIDVVFIDGDHHRDATLNYVDSLMPKMSEKGVLILHDIYWSKGMQSAWQSLQKLYPQAVFIDLFFVGFILLGRPQAGESFKVRFPPGWLFF